MSTIDLEIPVSPAPGPARNRVRGAVAAASVLFGTAATATRVVDAGPGAWTAASWRIIVGGVVLVVLSAAGGDRPWRRPCPRRVVVPGALAVVGMQVGYFGAVSRIGVAAATVIAIGSGPVAAGLFEWHRSGACVTPRWALGVALAGVGIAAVSGADGMPADPLAWAMAVGAGSCFPLYGASIRDLSADRPVLTAVATVFGSAALPAALVALLARGNPASSAGSAVVLVYLGVVTTALAYLLWARGLRDLSLGDTVTITMIEPVAATVFAVALLGERIGAGGVMGIAAVLAGISVATSTGRRAAEQRQ